MDNSPKQSGSADPAREPSFNLAERLLRRAAEPAGVIDVRQPQRIYERTAGWVARRFALLDHWRARYGDQRTASAGGEMILAAAPALSEGSGAFPGVTTLARAAAPPASKPDAPGFDAGVTVSPSPALRVSRRGARPANAPGSPARPNAPDETARPGSSGAVSLFSETPSESRTVGIAAAPDAAHSGEASPTPQFVLTTENFYQTPAGREMSQRDDTRPHEQRAVEASAPPLAREIQAEAPSVSLQLQRRHSGETVRPATSNEITRDSTADTQLSSAGSSFVPGGPVVSAVRDTPGAAMRRAEEIQEPAPGNTALPLATSRSQPLAAPQTTEIQRRPESAQAGDWPLSEQASPAVAAQSPQLPAVASEIPAASSGAPEPNLVWRKSASEASTDYGTTTSRAAASPLPLKIEPATAIAPIVARQLTTGAESGATSGIGAAPPMATESPAPARDVDVAQLAEQIGRLLSRQLAVERERRGMK